MEEKQVLELMRRAFVSGAAWWEYHKTHFTMWQSDQQIAYGASNARIADILESFKKEIA